jgi:hypothetical protein
MSALRWGKVDPVMWCICADYIVYGRDLNWIWRAIHNAPAATESYFIIRAADFAMWSKGNPNTLNRLAEGALLLACPPGDASSEVEQERRIVSLYEEILRRWCGAFRETLPEMPNLKEPFDPPHWVEYMATNRKWYEEHLEKIAAVFYSWTALHPEPDKDSDLTGLVDALISVRGEVSVPA